MTGESPETVECFNCGRTNPGWAQVCRHCGVPLQSLPVAASSGPIPTDRASLISIGGALVAIAGAVALGLAISALYPSRPGTGRVEASPLASVVVRPSTSSAPTLAATPAPAAKPTAALPGTVAFGTGLDRTTRQVVTPTDMFTPGSTFAHSVSVKQPFGVTQIYEQVARLGSGGTETVVQAPTDGLNVRPMWTVAGYAIQANVLIQAWGPGTYRMRVYLSPGGKDLIATGTFKLASG